MNKSAKGKDGRKAAGAGQLWLRLPGLVREALYDTVIGAGLACVDEVLEAERVVLCGERYEHLAERQALRAGHVASSVVLGGRRVAVQRPRARSVAGRELRLPSWREWSARDPLEQRAVEQMLVGVSTRGYALAGAATGSGRGTGHQQERGQRAVRLRHRAQVGGTDESRTARVETGGADDRWGALRRACSAGGGGRRCAGRQARVGIARRCDRECLCGAGLARRPGRARIGDQSFAVNRDRRRQSAPQ